ncbi:MAG: acyl-CoA dehydrogenase [Polyangiaceae bacterium UTPRO1]|jgi:glutaryl-CoA dehydrogenase|nr:acyl-CoA dehydrogenase family protein [Myxococcales bacterium]OQY67713.1 MAG: acyl-CoA dehydrogenase [Polyangiaceae bacterium UTPRO1]
MPAPDYYELDALLTTEERLTRNAVRAFVEQECLPLIEGCFSREEFPRQLIARMGELGVFGANLHGYGCAGMNNVAYGLAMQELERGDSALRSMASVQGGLAMYGIYAYGTEEQKARWLPRMARGEAIGCFGLTEPDHGSDPGGMEARARRVGSEWVLSGVKRWITNGSIADVAIVWAKTTPDDEIRGFLVERGTPGYGAHDLKGKFSLRASITSELVLEDVCLPASALLPGVVGLKGPFGCLNQARYGIVWGAVGAAMACYETALDYAVHRVQFDRPIAGFQLVQQKLVDMVTEITKAQLLAHRLGRLKDEGRIRAQQISLAKRNNVGQALHIARLARDVLGANGIVNDYPVIRHMLNLETVNTYEGTYDMHTLIVGRDLTGIDAVR